MPRVTAMHFVCRDDLNVTDFGDGTFETGVWYVAAKHAESVRRVALHSGRDQPSYRQGTVLGRRAVIYQGKKRFVFHVRDDGQAVVWVGGAAGEKGYEWGR